MYIKNPYLPEAECSLFVIDKRAYNYADKLRDVILTEGNNNLLDGIDTHPDMNICHLSYKDIVVSSECYEYYNKSLSGYGFNIIKGENKLRKEYPFDIALNCVILNNRFFHNTQYTDKSILRYVKENNFEVINVKQGYTKCSTLIVDENSVITSDAGLYKVYMNNGFDTLLVNNKDISLKNFNYGFIGGCGGRISDKKIAFFGKLEDYSDYNSIKEFVTGKGFEIVSLSDGNLTDFGSVVPLIHRR